MTDAGNLIADRLADLVHYADKINDKLGVICEHLAAKSAAAEKSASDDYLTVKEAAAFLKLSTASLYKLKHLQCRRGKSIRFKRSALENHIRPRKAA